MSGPGNRAFASLAARPQPPRRRAPARRLIREFDASPDERISRARQVAWMRGPNQRNLSMVFLSCDTPHIPLSLCVHRLDDDERLSEIKKERHG
jgi:hypothetical protein